MLNCIAITTQWKSSFSAPIQVPRVLVPCTVVLVPARVEAVFDDSVGVRASEVVVPPRLHLSTLGETRSRIVAPARKESLAPAITH